DEEKDKFVQVARPFNKNNFGQACEGNGKWNAEEFTTLRVASTARKNSHGRPIAYDVVSQRYGTLRRLQPSGGAYNTDMEFINQDFWVTRTESGFTNYIDLPRYAREKRTLNGHPTTIWLAAPTLHFPRTEDFDPRNGTNSFGGVAIVSWGGFEL